MNTLTNLELNTNLANPVIFFEFNSTTFALLIDGSEKVLSGDMCDIDENLTSQMTVDQNYNEETTAFIFDDFIIKYSNSEVQYEIL